MEVALGGFAGALGLIGLFGGLALLIWVGNKGETEKRRLKQELELQRRQMEHAERLKALESGLPLPDADLALARVEQVRAGVAAAVGLVVPVVTVGGAVAGTAIVLSMAQPQHHLPVLCVIWACSGVASLVTATTSLGVLASGRRRANSARGPAKRPSVDATPPELRERITTLERTGSSS
jgi:hypothetical protein